MNGTSSLSISSFPMSQPPLMSFSTLTLCTNLIDKFLRRFSMSMFLIINNVIEITNL